MKLLPLLLSAALITPVVRAIEPGIEPVERGDEQTAAVLPEFLPDHPRLLSTSQDWERVRRQVKTDPVSAMMFAAMQKRAERVMEETLPERVLEGHRLLGVARSVLADVSMLAALYRITGETRYADRAQAEMLAAAAFTDWNPGHFLDVAELSLALAIGYDWLHEELSEEARDTIATALIEKGLKPSFQEEFTYWHRRTNNWNQVCHTGMTAAAIVVADRAPELAKMTIQRTREFAPLAAASYSPDGAFPEGPMYWGYATDFQVLLIDALVKFRGTAFGLEDTPGLERTGGYIMDVTAPSGLYFNYSDAGVQRGLQTALFWLSAHYERPEWLEYDLERLDEALQMYISGKSNHRLLPMALLWRRPELEPKEAPSMRSIMYRGETPIAVFRVNEGEHPLYAAIKGGSPGSSHAHMDAGSFILEADGVRWALDLGMQGYNSLESRKLKIWDRSQESDRWKVFRIGPESHNILRIDGDAQSVSGKAEIVAFREDGGEAQVELDLSSLYPRTEYVKRSMKIVAGKAVMIQDEWKFPADESGTISWQMVTAASVSVKGDRLELTQDGRRLDMLTLNVPGASISVENVNDLIQAYDQPNNGISRIVINCPEAERGTLQVLLVPGSAGSIELP